MTVYIFKVLWFCYNSVGDVVFLIFCLDPFGQCPQAGMGIYIRTSALTCQMEVP